MNTENKTAPASFPETNEIYEAPVITMIEVHVEQGFATSGLDDIGEDTW